MLHEVFKQGNTSWELGLHKGVASTRNGSYVDKYIIVTANVSGMFLFLKIHPHRNTSPFFTMQVSLLRIFSLCFPSLNYMQCFESQRKETKGKVKKELERGHWKSLDMTEPFVSASVNQKSFCVWQFPVPSATQKWLSCISHSTECQCDLPGRTRMVTAMGGSQRELEFMLSSYKVPCLPWARYRILRFDICARQRAPENTSASGWHWVWLAHSRCAHLWNELINQYFSF